MKFFLFLAASTVACAESFPTATPIKHIILIFQENRTFDHYFGTYPIAQNNPGETPFYSKKRTPSVNGLTNSLQTNNQNLRQPFRLSPSQVNLGNPLHDYATLQLAGDKGLMDMFVQVQFPGPLVDPTVVMGYYDGNTVTALWNYAQFFSMSDNYHQSGIGQSAAAAINLISGNTSGATPLNILDKVVNGTLINDIDPQFDKCSNPLLTAALDGINLGNLLNANGITWGFFEGGFANCSATHDYNGTPIIDYVPHHNPFQYYQSTSNPNHLPPSSPDMIGKTDQANHLYDISDFWTVMESGNLPAVSILKAPAFQNGHGGNSNSLLEQTFFVPIINKLQTLPQWKNMAIIIAYDDGGGWYDHEPFPIVNDSQIAQDQYTAPGEVGTHMPLGNLQGRPGYGFRLPFILISPWAKSNFVDNTLIDQTSVLRFIEDNWFLGRIGNFSYDGFSAPITNMFNFKEREMRFLFLSPTTGAIEYKGK